MSVTAKTLMYWVHNSECNVDETNTQRDYCKQCALNWAVAILAGKYNE
jgi:hypothetical protein